MSVDEVKLRACTVADSATLALVGAATFLEAFAGRLAGEAILAHCAKNHTAAAYEGYLRQPEGRAWLAEIDGAPAGYLLLSAPELPAECVREGDLELKRIYLFSRFHGGGVAQRMMQRAIDAAREEGRRRLLLGVHRENGRALAFYERNGFLPVGVRTFQLGSSVYDDLVLGREVQGRRV